MAATFWPVGAPKAASASPPKIEASSAVKKENTVKAHREFDHIIHSGVKVKSIHYSLYGEKPADPEQTFARIGLAVGKANGKAVQRVRVKRQVRAMLDNHKDWMAWPLNLIIVIRPNFKEDEFNENEAELIASLNRLKELLN